MTGRKKINDDMIQWAIDHEACAEWVIKLRRSKNKTVSDILSDGAVVEFVLYQLVEDGAIAIPDEHRCLSCPPRSRCTTPFVENVVGMEPPERKAYVLNLLRDVEIV